jgi:hypothetical protein
MVEEGCSAFFKQANRARPLLVFVSHLLNASMVSTCGFGKLGGMEFLAFSCDDRQAR